MSSGGNGLTAILSPGGGLTYDSSADIRLEGPRVKSLDSGQTNAAKDWYLLALISHHKCILHRDSVVRSLAMRVELESFASESLHWVNTASAIFIKPKFTSHNPK